MRVRLWILGFISLLLPIVVKDVQVQNSTEKRSEDLIFESYEHSKRSGVSYGNQINIVMQSLMIGGKELTDRMTEQYWSRFADTYDRNMEYVVGKSLLYQITEELNHLPKQGKVVELGCGTGYFTKTMGQKSQTIMATDLSDSLLEAARKRLGECPNVGIQKENCMETSFPAEAFDCVFMANLIHVVESPGEALHECHRILRDGGNLIIVTFTGHGMKLWEKIKMGLRFVKSWGKPPAHTHSFSPEGLASIMEDAGFVIKTSKVIGDKTKALYLIARKDGTA